jgi:hyperosmotically inducible protein
MHYRSIRKEFIIMPDNFDDALAFRVKETIDNDPGMRPYSLSVDVNNGEVILQGIVDVLLEKERAEKLALSIPGVKGIDNAITISTDGKVNDAGVISEVIEELKEDPRIDLKKVGAIVRDGTVYLKGHVADSHEEQIAIEAAAKARGVKAVVSNLTIDSLE